MRLRINARNVAIGVEAGVIVDASGAFDAVIDAPDADLRPGLINAHDHLHRNHYGRLGKPPYRNSQEWAADIQHRYKMRIGRCRRYPRREALLLGAWKNLFAGVTTVVHHDPWESAFEADFPIRVARLVTENDIRGAGRIDTTKPYALHVAEGVDNIAAAETAELGLRGLLTANLLAVHAVAVDADAVRQLHNVGASVVWCPTSNMFMLGATAPNELLQSGVDVLLGSDSLLTGAGNLLDELRFAQASRSLPDDALDRAVGRTAAARLGIAPPSIEVGSPADLILTSNPIGRARAEDVTLVLVGGVPRVAAHHLEPTFHGMGFEGRRRTVAGVSRWTNMTAGNAVEGGTHEPN